jgi:hypothetical protein
LFPFSLPSAETFHSAIKRLPLRADIGAMRRRHLLLLALVVPTMTACAFPGTDAAKVGDCEDAFLKGVLQTPSGEAAFDKDELTDRIRPVCEAMVKAGVSDESSDAEVIEFLRQNPELAGELCEASTDALFENGFDDIVAAFDGYVTREEAMRLGRDGCVYAVTEGNGSFDSAPSMPALYRAHPYLVAPFCRAPLMRAYDRERPPQARRVYEEVVTEACMEGIRTGAVDYGMGNFLNPTIDQKRFRQLLRAELAERS